MNLPLRMHQGLAKTYSEQNAALTKENEELRKRLALYESGQLGPAQSTPRPTGATSAQPMLTRKASSDLAAAASSSIRGTVKRQRTRSISSNASSSSNTNYQTVASTSTTSSASMTSATSNTTIGGTSTAMPPQYLPATSRSPAALVIPSPTMSIHMHASPSPAASNSSNIPPSPPIPLGSSPGEQSSYVAARHQQRKRHSSGCGVCDSSNGTNCICQDIGLKSPHRSRAEDDELNEADFRDLNLLPSSSRLPSAMDRCGFCTESTTGACLCAEVGMRENGSSSAYQSTGRDATNYEVDENVDTLSPLPPPRSSAARAVDSLSSNLSSVPNIPPGTASVRLRLPKRGIAAGQIWRIDANTLPAPVPQQTHSLIAKRDLPVISSGSQRHPAAAAGVALRRKLIKVGSRLPCSGDPKTCLACADDP